MFAVVVALVVLVVVACRFMTGVNANVYLASRNIPVQ